MGSSMKRKAPGQSRTYVATAPGKKKGKMAQEPARKRMPYSFTPYEDPAKAKPEPQPAPILAGIPPKNPPKETRVWVKIAEGEVLCGAYLDAGVFLVRYDGKATQPCGREWPALSVLDPKSEPAGKVLAAKEMPEGGCLTLSKDGELYRIRIVEWYDITSALSWVNLEVCVSRVSQTT